MPEVHAVQVGPGAAAAYRQPKGVWLLLALGAAWSGALVVAALVWATPSSAGCVSVQGSVHLVCTTLEQTAVGRDGAKVLLVAAATAMLTGVVAVALLRRGRRGRRGPGYLAASVAGALCVVALLGVLTIGPLLAPVGVLVVAACACSGPAPSVADGPPAAGSPY